MDDLLRPTTRTSADHHPADQPRRQAIRPHGSPAPAQEAAPQHRPRSVNTAITAKTAITEPIAEYALVNATAPVAGGRHRSASSDASSLSLRRSVLLAGLWRTLLRAIVGSGPREESSPGPGGVRIEALP